ncbi:uncharacterized protein [Nicotiana tomentosiformis]|uniref:uncharacterized protein n=1 Tax=Nicotiana tomentosiformis TaxID=4098 RepID=UPI00388C45FC
MRKDYYEDLIKKVKDKLHSGKGKLLSFGEKATLISSVLQSKFNVSSAWQILRHRADPNQDFKLMWIKGLPFKISFFLWRLWRQKIVIDDIWRRQGKMVMSRCWCYQQPQEESIEHIFVTSSIASKVWNLFMGATGITVQLIQLKQIIRHWWYAQCCPKLKPLFQAVPVIITWELWKRRNASKHGGLVSTNRVIHEINRTLHQLARVSSLGFCVRDDEGDVVYARAVDLGVTTNVVVESKAILQGLEYCVEHDLHPLILETDSLVMKKAIKRE